MFILLLYDLQLQFSVHTFYIEQAYKIDTKKCSKQTDTYTFWLSVYLHLNYQTIKPVIYLNIES